MTKEELIKRIEKVFETVPYPGDQEITIHPLGLEEELEDYFRGKTWKGHPAEKLRDHQDALGLFTPAGYHYFLPAFLIATLEGENDLGWHIGFGLERGNERSTIKGKTKEELFTERIRLFSEEQVHTLIEFFRCLQETDIESMVDYERVIENLSAFLNGK